MPDKPSNIDLHDLKNSGVDHFTLLVTRDEVVKSDLTASKEVLEQLLSNPDLAKHFKERIDICFDGFNKTWEELWEIVEVRRFVVQLDNLFPYWLFFLSKYGDGLSVIIKCFLVPHLKPEGNREYNLPKLQDYLEHRGFPALNHICSTLGLDEKEIERLSQSTMTYIENRIFTSDSK